MYFVCPYLDIIVEQTIADYMYQLFLPLPLIILVIMLAIWLIKKVKQHKEDQS